MEEVIAFSWTQQHILIYKIESAGKRKNVAADDERMIKDHLL